MYEVTVSILASILLCLKGINSIHSRIRASGMCVQRYRVRSIVTQIRGDRGLMRNRSVCRRTYNVPGSLCMWHIDGNHKLLRYG